MSENNKQETLKEREYLDVFALFDKNNDGVISKQELGDIMSLLGQNATDGELQEMMNAVDEDKNGVIDYEEFVNMMNHKMSDSDNATGQLEAFRAFDKDGNGLISADELQEVLSSLGQRLSQEEVIEMIREADTDGDGFVNYDEFVAMMTTKSD